MRKQNLLSMLAGALLINGCATNIELGDRVLSPRTNPTNPNSEDARKATEQRWFGPDIPGRILKRTRKEGMYGNYFVETVCLESGFPELGRGPWINDQIKVVDIQGDKIMAKLEGMTSAYSPSSVQGEFFIYAAPLSIIPKKHPFATYTSEKLSEIYKALADNKEK